MIFSSYTFIISLFLVAILYYLHPNLLYRKILLLISSLLFYSQFSLTYLIALFFIIGVSFVVGQVLKKNKNKAILTIGIILNIAVLLCYKYNYLFGNIIEDIGYPIGLSFYVFQSISYIVDVNNRNYTEESDIISVCLYLSFFPKILAGPIEKASNLIPQFNRKQELDYSNIFLGMKILSYGFFCKILIADGLGNIVNSSISRIELFSGVEIFLTSLMYSFQIYFDFFSYSIIAIGLGKLFNIELSENFDRPYFSRTLKEFWRRWNITLLNWLREYVYIPLGGNRVSGARHNLNILIVFMVSGIWHGARLNFIIWGIGHGFLYITETFFRSRLKEFPWLKNCSLKIAYMIIMYTVISFLWLVFRVENLELLSKIGYCLIDFSSWFTKSGLFEINFLLIIITLGVFILQSFNIFKKFIFNSENNLKFIAIECLIINLFLLGFLFYGNTPGPGFIYFNF